jgi:hypothetical protein
VEAYALSTLENVERLLRDLGSDSKATYLKIKDRSDQPKVFIPVDDNPTSYLPEQQDYDQLLLVNPEDPHRTGLLLDAPGASLLALMEKESGIDFFDKNKESVLDALRTSLVESLEVAADVKGAFDGNLLTLRIREGLIAPSKSTRLVPKTSARLGCPICSAAACGVVKAMKMHVVLEAVAHDGRYHELTLKLLGGSDNKAR